MKKTPLFMAALLVSTVIVTVAQAEVCYRLSPFADILRLSIHADQGNDTGDNHQQVFGNWISPSYSLPVVGARELNRGSTVTRRLGIHGTNNSVFFNANRICAIDGIPGGSWIATCVGNAAEVRFTASGSPLTSIPCPGLAPSSQQDGGAVVGE